MLISIWHPAATPSWLCRTCGDPWPCAERKIRFLQDYEGKRKELRTLLSMFLIDATEDLTEPIEVLHERFVSWSIPVHS